MVPRFAKGGSSFKGVVQYLTHDAGHAATSERVAWTHTINLANDHVPSAVDEMYGTWRSAEALKAEAGVRSGGKAEKSLKHLSLNWEPSERPDRAEMIRAAETFLGHMGWQEHQCIVVCHNDKPHAHVHLVVSSVDPETGRHLNDSFERRRAQKWALGYERERGKIFCPQREKAAVDREPSPPRPVWELLQKARESYEQAEDTRTNDEKGSGKTAHDARKEAERSEWAALRELQHDERLGYFDAGRSAFKTVRNAVYRDVRKAFAPEWRGYFAAERAGADASELASTKADIFSRQRAMLEMHRDAACEALREQRDADYRQLLDQQKEARATLHERQERNTPSIAMLYRMAEAARAKADAALAPGRESDDERTRQRSGSGGTTRPFVWSDRAGLVQQERSAFRFLDRVAERSRKVDSPVPSAGNQAALRQLYEAKPQRVVTKDRHLAKPDKGMEPGPD